MMQLKLSQQERLIISEVELNAHGSSKDVAKQLGMKDYTVQHVLRRLRERGIITAKPFVDISKLGKINVGIFFTLALTKQKSLSALIKQVNKSPFVSFFQSLAGDYHFLAVLHCQNLIEIQNFLHSLSEWSNGSIVAKAVIPRVRYRQYRRKYLTTTKSKEGALEALDFPDNIKLEKDEFDLLSHLGLGQALSIRQVARELRLPYSTIDYRYQRLTKKGIIRGWFYDLDLQYLGVQQFKLLISCKNLTPSFEKRIEEFSRQHLNIVYLLQTLGEWDLELGVEYSRTEELKTIISQLHETFSEEIASIRSVNELDILKYTMFPDLSIK